LTETGDELIASTRSVALDVELTALGAGRAILQAGSAVPPFTVRNRRPGDRMRPLGAPGRRKVQDLMVDRKIPRETRDSVPIVVDATGRIVWVAGVAVADECRVTAPEAGVLLLELKK
jgi:tRNA(Ile)-lysidine synthetase-like protein